MGGGQRDVHRHTGRQLRKIERVALRVERLINDNIGTLWREDIGRVAAAAADQGIVARPGDEGGVARAGDERIVAGAGDERIIHGVAVDKNVAVGAYNVLELAGE